MSRENVEAIQDFYAATNERDFDRATSYWAGDVELVIPQEGSLLGGTFKGGEAVTSWFADWFSSFDRVRFNVTEIHELDDNRVLVVANHQARGRSSGAEMRMTVAWLYRLRQGKIARAELFASRADALEAVGLRE
jgi:ketosteroid isomerase-like protein